MSEKVLYPKCVYKTTLVEEYKNSEYKIVKNEAEEIELKKAWGLFVEPVTEPVVETVKEETKISLEEIANIKKEVHTHKGRKLKFNPEGK
jgi:hypothetical protein